MVNLTLAIEEETLKRARVRAIEQGTSVNAVVRAFLESFAGVDERADAMRRFVDLAHASNAGAEGDGRGWTRTDIYADAWRPS